MNDRENQGGCSPVLSTAGLCVGGRVRLLKSIYDDGEDHHPPGWLAEAGEVLIVKAVRGDVLAVAHEGNPGAFTIYPGEYEAHNAAGNRMALQGQSELTGLLGVGSEAKGQTEC